MRVRASTLPLSLFVMAIIIIGAGGLIRINDAGESCPEWPTCFGELGFVVTEEEQELWWQEHPDEIDSRGAEHRYTIFEIFTEWVHRLFVGIIAIPMIWNMIWTTRHAEQWGRTTARLAIASSVLLVAQAGVGALTVVMDNVDWSVALHLSMAVSFSSVLLAQWFEMRRIEGAPWPILALPLDHLHATRSRLWNLAGAVLVLLILGAWVSSSAGGRYNQACSTGFPEAWPLCDGALLPVLDHVGVAIQMLHRVAALLVGGLFILAYMRFKREAEAIGHPPVIARLVGLAFLCWTVNLLIGALYLVLADGGGFPEWLSLAHLVGGGIAFFATVSPAVLVTLAACLRRQPVMPAPRPTFSVLVQLMKLRVILLLQVTAICSVFIHDLLVRAEVMAHPEGRRWIQTLSTCWLVFARWDAVCRRSQCDQHVV